MRLLAATVLSCLLLAAPAAAAPRLVLVPKDRAAGTVIVLHGGGWEWSGADAVASMLPATRRFTRAGQRAVAADYGTGTAGLTDVLAAVDGERDRRGDDRVCLYGESAGGHLALLAAQHRPWLRCVIAVAAPTDFNAETPGSGLTRQATARLGPDLARWSPVTHAASIRARTLLVYARNDPTVGPAHGTRMAHRTPQASLRLLARGPARFHHTASVAPDQLRGAWQTTTRLARTSLRR